MPKLGINTASLTGEVWVESAGNDAGLCATEVVKTPEMLSVEREQAAVQQERSLKDKLVQRGLVAKSVLLEGNNVVPEISERVDHW